MPIAPSAELRALLTKQAYGHVVTINRDGSPQISMVWMVIRDGVASFNTAIGRRKERNLRRDPRIIVSVGDPDQPQQYALLWGTATLTEQGAVDQVYRLAKKYLDRDQYTVQPGDRRVTVNITVERVTGRGPWVA